jgi:hypothetical protein
MALLKFLKRKLDLVKLDVGDHEHVVLFEARADVADVSKSLGSNLHFHVQHPRVGEVS